MVSCSLSLSGNQKIFCRHKCEKGNILIQTSKESDKSGRYRIRSNERFSRFINVSITKLTQSDSGWYRCGVGSYSYPHSYQDFRLVVAEGESQSCSDL